MFSANGCAFAQNFYGTIGLKLVDSGYSAIPIEPGTKRPGRFSRGQWSGEHDWQRFCDRLPTEIETNLWSRNYSGAGIGIALGYNQVVAVDIDSNDPALTAEIEGLIGHSPVGKVGNRGVTWFFRAAPGFKTTHFKCSSGDGVDLLGPGTQTVIPPTVHPATGKSYRWREDGESLELVPPERLPMLPADIADCVGEVMKRYGWTKPVLHEHARGGNNGVWAVEKAAAMETREEWLPRLGFELDRSGKRMNAAWRGSVDHNVAVYSDGFYDHVENRSMSAIDVVMEIRQCSNSEAVEWLRPWIHIEEPEVVHLDFGRRDRVEEQQALEKRAHAETSGATSQFALTWLSDISLNLDAEWLFKWLIPKVGVISVFGDSMSFKTFLLIHIFVCAATGKDFGGHKCKNPGPCVYVAAEDALGVEKRLIGYCMAHGLSQTDVPIAIVRVAPNLGTVKGDAFDLARAIDAELAAQGYASPSAIAIDTLNQTLGDSEENGPGMQAFMVNATVIAIGFECPVFAANHVGHTEKNRERGGSQIKGNADTRLQIERVNPEPIVVDGIKTFETLIHARKVKNGEDGFSLKATLRQFVLGTDSDGDEVTTLVVDRVERMGEEAATKRKKSDKPPSKAKVRRDGFEEAYHHIANDVEPTLSLDRRTKVRKVSVGAIHKHMKAAGLLDGDQDGKRFSELKLEMIAPKTGRFIERDGMIWIVKAERAFEFTSQRPPIENRSPS
jgi:hypothetical protein